MKKSLYSAILMVIISVPLFSKDGIYTGAAVGKNGDIEISVTVKDSKISNIEILSSDEDKEFVYPRMIPVIISNNNINVDIVSGASYTSRGFLKALERALSASGINFKGELIKPADK